jgi:hypothetical protein
MPFKPAYAGEIPSLGWELIEIWADVFPSPRDESEPFVLTDEQAVAIVEWYSIDPKTGRFVYRRGCSRRSKGVGKSPIEAAKCISELALPVRFAGWDADGRPVGRPWGTMGDPAPWVQIAALSEDQDDNTYTPLHYFLTASDGRLADELGVDAGLTRCFLRNRPGAKIEPVTSKAGSREGQPVTYGCLDESGLMTPENGGVRLARTIRRNTTKMGGRSFETTNGFIPGSRSVAEETDKTVMVGTSGIYYDAVEAPTHIDGVEVSLNASDEVLRRALEVSYGDASMGHVSSTGVSGWVDLDRLVADIRDADMPWEDSERFFFNWNRRGSGQAIDPEVWRRQARPGRIVQRGERIGLGFDGSITTDTTALVGCTADFHSFLIAVWERPEGPRGKTWRVPRLEVADKIWETFETYDVGLLICDPPRWETEIDEWADWYRVVGADEKPVERVLKLDTYSARRFAPACDRAAAMLAEGRRTHDDNPTLTAHVLAMGRKKVRIADDAGDGRTRYVWVKADTRRIDAGIADTLAVEAAATMPGSVKPIEPAWAPKPSDKTGAASRKATADTFRPKQRLKI